MELKSSDFHPIMLASNPIRLVRAKSCCLSPRSGLDDLTSFPEDKSLVSFQIDLLIAHHSDGLGSPTTLRENSSEIVRKKQIVFLTHSSKSEKHNHALNTRRSQSATILSRVCEPDDCLSYMPVGYSKVTFDFDIVLLFYFLACDFTYAIADERDDSEELGNPNLVPGMLIDQLEEGDQSSDTFEAVGMMIDQRDDGDQF